jgi:hypothetical protein
MTDATDAVNSMSSLSPDQLDVANQIIAAGNLAGEPAILIQTAVLFAFAEFSWRFNANAWICSYGAISVSARHLANQIIATANLVGESSVVIQAAVLIAFSEFSLGKSMQVPGLSATKLATVFLILRGAVMWFVDEEK